MNLQRRIDILTALGNYFLSYSEEWKNVIHRAHEKNSWFLPEFIQQAASSIAQAYLRKESLLQWSSQYGIPEQQEYPLEIGIVMAGNIPMVGFHDLLCVFIAGHKARVKLSSRDEVLMRHIVEKLTELDPGVSEWICFEEQLKGCHAYIATGSNNSARYFDFYFSKYPHIIRKNRTSVAILDGKESILQLEKLSDDIMVFFGLGCRNVTKLYVPPGFDFQPLLNALKKYDWFMDFHKYKNNFDYNLTLQLMNRQPYLSNDICLLIEHPSLFSPIGEIHYEYYTSREELLASLPSGEVQAIIGEGFVPFGQAQSPSLTDYADGIDTLRFVADLRIPS